MRHVYVNRTAILLAVLLILAAGAFAWLRSENRQLVLLIDEARIEEVEPEPEPEEPEPEPEPEPEEPEPEPEPEPEEPEPEPEPEEVPVRETVDWDWEDTGESTWAGQCRTCHSTLEHIPDLVAREDGRDYLIDFLLYGYEGEIEIEGDVDAISHVSFASLSNEEIAAVLNHMLVSWDNEEDLPDDTMLYEPDDIEERRDQGLEPADVPERRPDE